MGFSQDDLGIIFNLAALLDEFQVEVEYAFHLFILRFLYLRAGYGSSLWNILSLN